MGKNLVIVESPAKAKTIGKFLGKNYTVKASVGHIRDLPKSKMGIDIENNYEPGYINIRGKGPVIKELKKYAKNYKTMVRDLSAFADQLNRLKKLVQETLSTQRKNQTQYLKDLTGGK